MSDRYLTPEVLNAIDFAAHYKTEGLNPMDLDALGRSEEAQQLRWVNGFLADHEAMRYVELAAQGEFPFQAAQQVNYFEEPDTPQTEKPKTSKKKKRGWWPEKPETYEDWVRFEQRRSDEPGTLVTYAPESSHKGWDILQLFEHNNAKTQYACGCIHERDARGNNFLSPCGHDDCEGYANK